MDRSIDLSEQIYQPNELVVSLISQLGDGIVRQRIICRKTVEAALALGVDREGRGLHWHLGGNANPEYRLALSLAVHCRGGTYAVVDEEHIVLCVNQVSISFARLFKNLEFCPYHAGHAFLNLYMSLGYIENGHNVFRLLVPPSLARTPGFVKGFTDALSQLATHQKNKRSGGIELPRDLLTSALMKHSCNR